MMSSFVNMGLCACVLLCFSTSKRGVFQNLRAKAQVGGRMERAQRSARDREQHRHSQKVLAAGAREKTGWHPVPARERCTVVGGAQLAQC